MSIAKWLETGRSALEDAGHNTRYWVRTTMGLESIVINEIEARFPAAKFFQSHRNVFVELSGPESQAREEILCQLRTADDVYRYLGCCRGIDNTKASVDKLMEYFGEQIVPLLPAREQSAYIRLTLSFVGKRNFNRFMVENHFNELMRQKTKLIPLSNEAKESKKTGELRLRCHLEADVAFVGIGLQDTPLHRRHWRNIPYTGQLHTPIAAAMARALAPKNGAMIIDPFCGSGTILIESAIQYPAHPHQGYDLEPDAVAIARESAVLAGVSPAFKVQDSLQWNPDEKDYYLISNPPWHEKHQIHGGDTTYFMEQLSRLVAGSAGAVLLLPEELVLQIRQEAALAVEELAQTRVRGKLAWMISINGHH